jgi:phosphodiesterase/alkaline phosphatase D-like protein
MAWKPLSERINQLPLILAGPILRRTESGSVTVWVALKESRTVELEIYNSSRQQLFTGSRRTVQLGTHLHVVAVTAKSPPSAPLQPGQLYFYDLNFGNGDKLATPGVLAKDGLIETIAYSGLPLLLPSFALPPGDLNRLRLIHASCRKPHAEGFDALATLDVISNATAADPYQRPHQLFLTGDQIYADDVADALLHALTDAGNTLLGWEEILPGVDKKPQELEPGERQDISEDKCGFTSTEAKSHLFGLGEFYAMYLFAWSDVLWQNELPDLGDDDENTHLNIFQETLKKVRRGLANVPTYMMFDDHEITDDWYILRRWCKQVIAKPLGRRVIQNGLLAFAVFQAWGNTPDQFENDKPGNRLLDAASNLSKQNSREETINEIAHLVGLPSNENETALFLEDLKNYKQLTHDPLIPEKERTWHGSLNWHYTVAGPSHQVIVLDSRTWREYPPTNDKEHKRDKDDTNYPALLSQTAFQKQIPDDALKTSKEVTIVVASAPVMGVPAIESLQKLSLTVGQKYENDTETWTFQSIAFERLLARLAAKKNHRVLFLSGDVHYGFAARLQYWAEQPFEVEDGNRLPQESDLLVAAQLTSSALKNETRKGWGVGRTYNLHRVGYEFGVDYLPDSLKFLGWNNKGKDNLHIGSKTVFAGSVAGPLIAAPIIKVTMDWTVAGNPGVVNLTEEQKNFLELKLTTPLGKNLNGVIELILFWQTIRIAPLSNLAK